MRKISKTVTAGIAAGALALTAAATAAGPGAAAHQAAALGAGVALGAVHQLLDPDYADGSIPKPEAATAPGCPGYEYNGCDTASSPRNTSWG